MRKTLMILEVSQKQNYIFSSKKLQENASRSEDIRYVTSSEFFEHEASDLYSKQRNLINSGGGHAMLQFDDDKTAAAFAQRVTEAALRRYHGLELFAKQLPYDEKRTPGENLLELTKALERKKSVRSSSLRRMDFGVETLDKVTFHPVRVGEEEKLNPNQLQAPEGWCFPAKFEDLAGEDNFIAVVHLDGNAMGTRVGRIYEMGAQDWDGCCARLCRFSEAIQQDFETAFQKTVEDVIRLWGEQLTGEFLPIRPVVLAGDDVCFVTAGAIGLECARLFLEHLTAMTNSEDGKVYAACAGVAMVHRKYPFHMAYDLAEELCDNAKRFGSQIDANGGISAMDWHIEFGQFKGGLSEVRQEYVTEDDKRLELRPVTVIVPEELEEKALQATDGIRDYGFFRSMCKAMKGEYGKIARSKIKELRNAMKQGKVESDFFLQEKEVGNLLYHCIAAGSPRSAEKSQARQFLERLEKGQKTVFLPFDGEDRCLLFDAIELIDHSEWLEEVTDA